MGVYVSTNNGKIYFSTDELQILLGSLTVASVCSEARSQTIKFCQEQIRFTHLIYPDLDEGKNSAGDEASRPLFVHPKKIMISNRQEIKGLMDPVEGFESAEQLLDVVNRVFGSWAEHIILTSWVHGTCSLEEIYWPHSSRMTKKWRRQEM